MQSVKISDNSENNCKRTIHKYGKLNVKRRDFTCGDADTDAFSVNLSNNFSFSSCNLWRERSYNILSLSN